MTATLTPQLVTQLREKAAKPGYWTGGCANWSCANKVCEYVVADEYYASHEDARADGVEWGMRICRSCKRNVWPDTLVLLKRERCEFNGTAGCRLSGEYFVQVSGERKWYCAHDIALYVRAGFDIYRIDGQGQVIHAAEKMSEILNG